MQPGQRLADSWAKSSSDIHRPSSPATPSATCGTDSYLDGVTNTVFDSTRATSAGFVRAR